MTDINEIASKHLGRTSDGAVMKAYVTPDSIDPSLLVAIPRSLNRTQYNISDDNLPFYGLDVWNAYEVSFMTSNGLPVSCVAKIIYPADSECIVESKSLKLYLNSFNMFSMSTHDVSACVAIAADIIKKDLAELLKCEVDVTAYNTSSMSNDRNAGDLIDAGKFPNSVYKSTGFLEHRQWSWAKLKVTEYSENPDILELELGEGCRQASYSSSLLRSNCRVTNQPDWGDVHIFMEGRKIITEDSMLKYIISMRNENHFHEEICECIYKRLLDLCQPDRLVVGCLYTRRGGIDINPVRSKIESDLGVFNLYDPFAPNRKTMRQ